MKRFDISELRGKIRIAMNWMKNHHFPPFLIFYLTGVLSSIWFLIRVIPKPSRAYYPCMQVAAPVMSGFVVYLLSLGGITLAFRKIKTNILRARYISACLFILVALAGMTIALINGSQDSSAVSLPVTGPDDGPNQPIGKALGTNPGRVVWVWNPDATNEKCMTGFDTQDWYFKSGNTNPQVVRNMVRDALNNLTGKTKVPESWDVLFRYQNLKKYNKNDGYRKGEKIFIKINQGTSRLGLTTEDKNNGFYYPATLKPGEEKRKSTFGATETGPWIVLELLRELVNESGVNQTDITVGDPMTDICGHNYEVWFGEFPGVVYTGKFGAIHGRTLVKPTENDLLFYSDKTKSDKLYDVIENADYLINVANLKPHLSAGISLTAKNHFGSQARTNASHLHYSLMVPIGANTSNFGYHKYRVLVDLMGSRYLGQNTVLYLVDGLFGGGSWETRGPVRYFMAPFNNDWSSSIFVSQDQVALESVCFDFLRTEWNGINKHDPSNNSSETSPNINGVDDYLHQAADSSNWPAGIQYDPDKSGKPLHSLGTHEHWNNSEKKEYSRNLGFDKGIELVSVPDTLVNDRMRTEKHNDRSKKKKILK
jgi:hypothetical protein